MTECNRSNCEEVAKRFFEFLDNEMVGVDKDQLEKHLHDCRKCFDQVEFEKILREHMRQKTNHCCPEKIKNKIKKLIDEF